MMWRPKGWDKLWTNCSEVVYCPDCPRTEYCPFEAGADAGIKALLQHIEEWHWLGADNECEHCETVICIEPDEWHQLKEQVLETIKESH